MMMTRLALAEALRASDDLSISESNGVLTVEGTFSAHALQHWKDTSEEFEDCGHKIVCRDDIGEERDLLTEDLDKLSHEILRITATFAQSNAISYAATERGLRLILEDTAQLKSLSEIKCLLTDTTLTTMGISISPWSEPSSDIPTRPTSQIPSPRRLVRAIAGPRRVPIEIDSWITTDDLDRTDQTFVVWKGVASEAICRCLVNEIYEEDNDVKVVLSGTPTRRVKLGIFSNNEPDFEDLQKVARWIFVEGPDVELRHTLITNELARDWPADGAFSDNIAARLPIAIESANLAYKAHVQQGSKDTIKNLGDLRKSLAEDIAKVTQQTKDMTTSLWRDIAVAITAFAFKFSLDATKPSIGTSFNIILIMAAAYITASFYMSSKMNEDFRGVISSAREEWRQKGYGFLSNDDYEKIAGKPLKEATDVYDAVRKKCELVAYGTSALIVFYVIGQAGAWKFLLFLLDAFI